MSTEDDQEQLTRLVTACQAAVLYQPLRDEVDYRDCPLFQNMPTKTVATPPKGDTDPFLFATKYKNQFGEKSVCILIPGRQFDLAGTRHGHGGGWYDRFLSSVPKNWLRIGIATKAQISSTPLTREKWDEPIDWLIVQNGNNWETYKSSKE